MRVQLNFGGIVGVVVTGLCVAAVVFMLARHAARKPTSCQSTTTLLRDGLTSATVTCAPGQVMLVSNTPQGPLVSCACEGRHDVIEVLCGRDAVGVAHMRPRTSPAERPFEKPAKKAFFNTKTSATTPPHAPTITPSVASVTARLRLATRRARYRSRRSTSACPHAERCSEPRILAADREVRAYEEGAQMAASVWRRSYDDNHERWRKAYERLLLLHRASSKPRSPLQAQIDVLSVVPNRPKGEKSS